MVAIPSVAASRRDMRTGWVWYTLPQIDDGTVLLSITLAFKSGAISTIQISDASPQFGTNWSDWSEEKEQLRVESIAAWLTAWGYPPARYSWGEVWAAYDLKGGAGLGGIRYT